MNLDGAMVSVTWVPQARAVRVVGGTPPVDMLLLELYLENERRSGGGPLEGLRSLPRQLGTVVSFQQWQGEWAGQTHGTLPLPQQPDGLSVFSFPPSG